MWKLPVQDISGVSQHLITALTYANGTPVYALSEAERSAILAVYQLYDAILGQPNPDLTPAILAACKPYMYNAYDQVQIRQRLASLRSTLLASTDACPYCGFGEPTELDHYLPRSVYGELAIYPNNLIPSCGPCNNAKRALVPGAALATGPSLIHAYFQELPAVEFLQADVLFDAGALNVTFRIDDNVVDAGLAAKLSFQLTRLKLNERYPRQINKFLSEQRVGFLLFQDRPAELADFLMKTAASLSRSYGRNDWRAALVRSLAITPDFCASPALYVGSDTLVPVGA